MNANPISNRGRGSEEAYFLKLELEPLERLKREERLAAVSQREFGGSHIRRTHGSRVGSHPRYTADRFHGPLHFARQVAVASRLASAAAFAGHSALLLSCGEPGEPRRAEDAVRTIFCPIDSVDWLPLPIQSWAELLAAAPESASWLERHVMREIHRREPSLISILCRGGAEPGGDASRVDALIAMLRRWGVTALVAALVVRPETERERVAAPRARHEDTR
jgi:hypothetical protein